MTRYLLIFTALLVAFSVAVSVAKNPDDAKIERQENNCDLSDIMEFRFDEPANITLIIPKVYFRSKLQVSEDAHPPEWIGLEFSFSTLEPVCSNPKEKNKVLITLNPTTSQGFEKIVRRYETENDFVKKEGGFTLYRSNKYLNTKRYLRTKDVLVPIDEELKKTIFILCSKQMNAKSIEDREGCSVYSLYREGVRLKYSLRSSQLDQYLEYDQRIKDKLDSFIVSSQPTEGQP